MADGGALKRVSRQHAVAMVAASAAAVILGLAAIDLVVLRMLQPQLTELRVIADDHARAVSTATQIRERMSEVRRRVTATVLGSAPSFDPAGTVLGNRPNTRCALT